MKIYHCTTKEHAKEIIDDGYILTERECVEKQVSSIMSSDFGRVSKSLLHHFAPFKMHSYSVVGSYVWFTENPNYCGTASGTDFCFEFEPREIGAVRWSTMVMSMRSKKKRFHIKCLNETGREMGDDPNLWWVARNRVSLGKETGNMLQLLPADKIDVPQHELAA